MACEAGSSTDLDTRVENDIERGFCDSTRFAKARVTQDLDQGGLSRLRAQSGTEFLRA